MPWGSCTGEVAPTQVASISFVWSMEKNGMWMLASWRRAAVGMRSLCG
jgi:hypothetical protein